jgi:glutamate racemase
VADGRPIGVFDSGLGGLTVARAIMEVLPQEPVVYFGDTARFPYGPRPLEETRAFAVEIARYLVDRDAKIVVVACNTATAAALDDVAAAVDVPVIGVIDPAVRAAMSATRNGRVGLIGTAATVASGSYERALARLDPEGRVELVAQACPQFVDFVERGDTTSPELLRVVESSLTLLRVAAVDTLILGCTHYPLLRAALRRVMGDDVALVSSADETAVQVYETLQAAGALREDASPPQHAFESSGDTAKFASLLTLFMRPEFHDVRAVPLASGPAG